MELNVSPRPTHSRLLRYLFPVVFLTTHPIADSPVSHPPHPIRLHLHRRRQSHHHAAIHRTRDGRHQSLWTGSTSSIPTSDPSRSGRTLGSNSRVRCTVEKTMSDGWIWPGVGFTDVKRVIWEKNEEDHLVHVGRWTFSYPDETDGYASTLAQ
jgi:hypothetical protein